MLVGATDIGDPKNPKDDVVANFSGETATVAAPGVRMPVGMKRDGRGQAQSDDRDGTSFAAPYAGGIVALMIKANPKITPDEIEAILTDPTVARDLPGTTRDGAGEIDPVAAVSAAKAKAR
jgi:subtilisin family serine protease